MVPKNDLQVGQQGPAVEKMQRLLVATGYLSQKDMDTGPGNFGTRTQAALAKFQTDHGITGNNGTEFGPRSRAALERLLGR
ncbi:MAG TPA: peptidoglycan-binding domain-containing protein [Archangium sp.]|nr:peptidoglycan-binding domain-containing protein [Archangium sp.]